ncbi:MAG: hypothetical protein ACE5R6_21395 [Candidatus Heimdallarchaeota archaeon]
MMRGTLIARHKVFKGLMEFREETGVPSFLIFNDLSDTSEGTYLVNASYRAAIPNDPKFEVAIRIRSVGVYSELRCVIFFRTSFDSQT